MISYIKTHWQSISFISLLIISFLMIARTTGLVFEADDFLLLLWAKDNLAQPWNAFFDHEMFGYYYRPMVVLAWWFHVMLFGANPFWHHIALGFWWLSIVMLVVVWGKQTHSLGLGSVMGLLFLCSDSGHNVLLWKSWLTQILGIVFQLASLVTLRFALIKGTVLPLVVAFILFLCASTSKESALFCLPWVSLAMIYVTTGFKKQGLIYGIGVLIITISLYATLPALQRIFDHGVHSKREFMTLLMGWGNFAHQIWGSSIYQCLGAIITLLFYLTEPVWKWQRLGGCVVLSLIFLFISLFNSMVFDQATALAVFVFMLGIASSSAFRLVLPQWLWVNFAFWPLPVMSIPMIAYGADASVALALVLGTILWILWQRLKAEHGLGIVVLPLLKILGGFIFIILLSSSMIYAFMDLDRWAMYGTHVFHVPFQSVSKNAIDDIHELNPQGPMYVELDIWPETDHFLAFMLPMRFGHNVIQTKPSEGEGYYRLESFTNRHYHRRPEDEPVQFWLKPRVGQPTVESWWDPYYHPEYWDINIISNCDQLTQWQGENLQIATFPLGQGQGYVAMPWQGGKPIEAQVEFETLEQEGEFTLTFWLHTIRWDQVGDITINLYLDDQHYQWDVVQPQVINHFNEWRRVVLQSGDANVSDTTNTSNQLSVKVTPRSERPEPLGLFGIDEVRVSYPKDVEFMEEKRAGL